VGCGEHNGPPPSVAETSLARLARGAIFVSGPSMCHSHSPTPPGDQIPGAEAVGSFGKPHPARSDGDANHASCLAAKQLRFASRPLVAASQAKICW
jgi:hypothetical protein